MTTMTVTEARKELYGLLDELAESHEPVQIAGKRHSAVLIGEDDWRAVQETLYIRRPAATTKDYRPPYNLS